MNRTKVKKYESRKVQKVRIKEKETIAANCCQTIRCLDILCQNRPNPIFARTVKPNRSDPSVHPYLSILKKNSGKNKTFETNLNLTFTNIFGVHFIHSFRLPGRYPSNKVFPISLMSLLSVGRLPIQ